jgi:hypothetical protein
MGAFAAAAFVVVFLDAAFVAQPHAKENKTIAATLKIEGNVVLHLLMLEPVLETDGLDDKADRLEIALDARQVAR